jgi:TolA-binding protein
MSVKAGLANELTKQQARLVSLQEQRDALMESLAQSSNAAKQLEEQKAVLSRQEAEIEERRTRIEILEDMFNIVREEWDVGRDSAMVIVDETFRAGREDLKNKKYDMAISMFHEILKTYPESPLIYRMLYKALYLSGQEEEADQVYQKYAELLKKEILKDS